MKPPFPPPVPVVEECTCLLCIILRELAPQPLIRASFWARIASGEAEYIDCDCDACIYAMNPPEAPPPTAAELELETKRKLELKLGCILEDASTEARDIIKRARSEAAAIIAAGRPLLYCKCSCGHEWYGADLYPEGTPTRDKTWRCLCGLIVAPQPTAASNT